MIHQPANSRGNHNYNAYIYDNTKWDVHFHRNFELIFVMSGRPEVTLGSIVQTLSEGEFLLIPPGMPHGFTVMEDRVWVGVFSEDFVPDFAKKNSRKLYSPFKSEKTAEDFLRNYLLYEGTPEHYILKSCLYTVCSQCEKYAKALDIPHNRDITNEILKYMSENFTDNVTMEAIAEKLGYEYHYFSKLFHQCFSMNFREFLNQYRFERACEMIFSSGKSFTEIALESGFQSIRSFNRVFRKLSGKTPNELKAELL